jgi:hypothetical protein
VVFDLFLYFYSLLGSRSIQMILAVEVCTRDAVNMTFRVATIESRAMTFIRRDATRYRGSFNRGGNHG